MSWLEETSRDLAKLIIEFRLANEEAPVQVHQIETGKVLSNLATLENAVLHFQREEKSLAHKNPEWFRREVEALSSARRKVALEGAARLVLYYLALGEEEKEDGRAAVGG